MKRYINLFEQQASQKHSVVILRKMRKVGFYLVVSLFIVIALEWGAYFFFTSELAKKQTQLSVSQKELSMNQELVQKITIFISKYRLLKQFLKEDSNASVYYGMLTSLITSLGQPAEVTSFTIDNTQSSSFSLKFTSYNEAIKFLSAMETKGFTNYFDTLTLNQFGITESSEDGYTLQFEGKFKKIADGT